jgi:hypothetical protein
MTRPPEMPGSVLATNDADAPPHIVERSAFLRFLSRAGIAVVAATAGLLKSEIPALASHGGCHVVGCCCLAFDPGGCPGNGSTHTCASGYTKRFWACCESGQRVRYCSECTTGATCWTGTFKCSETWTSNILC